MSLETVFLLAPVSRVTARMELPSQRRWRIWARCSLVSRFILTIMRSKGTYCQHRSLHYVEYVIDAAKSFLYKGPWDWRVHGRGARRRKLGQTGVGLPAHWGFLGRGCPILPEKTVVSPASSRRARPVRDEKSSLRKTKWRTAASKINPPEQAVAFDFGNNRGVKNRKDSESHSNRRLPLRPWRV